MSSLKGLDELLSNLSGLGGNVESAVEKGLGRGAKKIQASAKLLAPVRTGELRNSIKTQVINKGGDVRAKVYTNCGHAPYVEFGTGERGMDSNIDRPDGVSYNPEWKGQTAQPFMTPAYLHAKNSKEVETEIEKVVKAEIGKLGGKG